jgi:hypothetical protein
MKRMRLISEYNVGVIISQNEILNHISTYSHEQIKTIDLFPRTDNTHKNHARPIPANGQNEKYRPDIGLSLSFHVECVTLMSRV